MTLTSDQIAALARGAIVQTTVDDTECVVLRKDLFDGLRDADELSHDELREILSRSPDANGWDEPAMDDYDRYDELRGASCR